MMEGRAEEARDILLSLGRQRLGPPDRKTTTAIESIESADVLDAMAKRILAVESWNELIGKS